MNNLKPKTRDLILAYRQHDTGMRQGTRNRLAAAFWVVREYKRAVLRRNQEIDPGIGSLFSRVETVHKNGGM